MEPSLLPLISHMQAGKDFYEGVRAVIVDKDNKHQWDPTSLSEVTQEMVLQHFACVPEHLELKLWKNK